MKNRSTPSIIQRFTQYGLVKRTISGIIMAFILMYSLYKGGIVYNIFISIIALAVLIEWFLIVKNADSNVISARGRYKWYIFGLLYSCTGLFGLYLFRSLTDDSENYLLNTMFWLWLISCTTDIGAYFTGIIVGGPKIWQRASPTKTWAGFFGAIIFSSITVCSLVDYLYIEFNIPWYSSAIMATLVSLISQMGDLLESLFKRRFKVKDSSNIIPGHGGVMDRVDGIFAVVIVLTIALYVLYASDVLFNTGFRFISN